MLWVWLLWRSLLDVPVAVAAMSVSLNVFHVRKCDSVSALAKRDNIVALKTLQIADEAQALTNWL